MRLVQLRLALAAGRVPSHCTLMAAKMNGAKRSSSAPKPIVDPNTQAGLEAFKTAAAKYTSKTTASKAAAIAALQKQGLLTPTGRLARRYASSS